MQNNSLSLDEIISETTSVIQQQGFTIDQTTPPFKDFRNKRDRFFVQKCFTNKGEAVVVKVSDLDLDSAELIKAEVKKYHFLEQIIDSSKDSVLHFPKLITQFSTPLDQQAIVISFVQDDPLYKKMLTPNEKSAIIITILKKLHKIPISEVLLAKEAIEKQITVLLANDIAHLWSQNLKSLEHSQVITVVIVHKLTQIFSQYYPLLQKQKAYLVHGDIHTSNIALQLNQQIKRSNITLLDIEDLKISNRFYDLAQISNRTIIYQKLLHSSLKLPKEMKETITEVFLFFNDPELILKLKRAFIQNEQDERMFHIMQVFNALEWLARKKDSHDEISLFMKQLYIQVIQQTSSLL